MQRSTPMIKICFYLFLMFYVIIMFCKTNNPINNPTLSAPNNVEAIAGNKTITITFDVCTDAESYNIYWSLSPNLTKSDNIQNSETNTYVHKDLTNGTTYYYAVSSVNKDDESDLSEEVHATPSSTVLPQPPQNVKAIAGNGKITITFDSSMNATSYNVYWSLSANVTTSENKETSKTSPFEHKNLTNNTAYYYAVTAVNENGESDLSEEVSATPNNTIIPQPPENLKVIERDKKITISWDQSINATSYNLYWSLSLNVTKSDNKISVEEIFYIHKELTNGTAYYYAVSSLNANGESDLSEEISAVPHITLIPDAPLNVKAVADDKKVTITFDSSMYAESYNIYWALSPNVSKTDNKDSSTATIFEHTNLTNGTMYYYAVTAVNANGESALSAEVKAKPTNLKVPFPPENIKIQKKDNALLIHWDPSVGAISYHLYWANSPNVTKDSTKIEHVVVPYEHTGLTNGITYYYALTALNNWGESDLSNEVMAIPNVIVIDNGMALIEAGGKNFQMGSNEGEDEEKPVHTISFSNNFWMDTSEITQKNYETIMGVNPSNFKGENLPVENITWFDAVLYCNARSKKDSYDSVYSFTSISGTPGNGCTGLGDLAIHQDKNGYRLPSEAQWEYACRGGTTTEYFFGVWADSATMSPYVWYTRNSNLQTNPVGQTISNEYILYDMSGNVWEWCNDWYSETYYSVSPEKDPEGPENGSSRIIRGGCWFSRNTSCRSATRGYLRPGVRQDIVGFRCVKP